MLMLVLKCTRSFKFINGSHHISASLVWLCTRTMRSTYALPFNMNLFTFSSFSFAVYISIAYLTTNTVVAHNDGGLSRSFYLFLFFFVFFFFFFILYFFFFFFFFSFCCYSSRILLLNRAPVWSRRDFFLPHHGRIHSQIKSCVGRHLMPCCFNCIYCLCGIYNVCIYF